ncbi:hypothetical protein DM02DRAFT_613493 [Periconia macrospinosa]|uniref:Integral membrane protein n=1 Tax=Periconia macrospinosa TaxID=97972 RepID=A0A2V1DTZ5_9PLEO|nr:hypothetical protein DM02DRAFT_613493 [Periconia macrospinosa]
MAPSFLHSTSPILYNFAGVMIAMPLGLGLAGLINPANGFKLFNFGVPNNSEARKLGTNMMLFWVSRDLFMAAVSAAAWLNGDRKTLGWTYLAGCGVAISDGIMSQRQIEKDAWKHVMWLPVIISIAGGLLGWWD